MRPAILAGCLLVMMLIAAPAGAFTADTLEVGVNEDGSANIAFEYTLSWLERIGVFFRIAEPEQELKAALEGAAGVPVTVTAAESDRAVFSALKFAKVTPGNDGVIYSTPEIDLTGAQKILDDYWFAPLVRADFSPDLTVVRFPDGYEERFNNQSTIPALSHAVPKI